MLTTDIETPVINSDEPLVHIFKSALKSKSGFESRSRLVFGFAKYIKIAKSEALRIVKSAERDYE